MKTIKRALDLFGAVIGLILTAPLLAASAAAIKLTMGSPVLFRQVRPGRGGAPFTMYKFRTMLPAAGNGVPTPPDEERLTALGRFLRTTSLDELPELFNVLKGDMSLVGPRPLLMAYLDRYTDEQARRHEIRPGITGWAQVSGRNALAWENKFKFDVWYVDNRSLWLDLKILVLTLLMVVRREGIAAPEHATMPEFTIPARPVNVLLSSAGRRIGLLRAFAQAAHSRGGRIFAADADSLAPALFLADEGFQLPRIDEPQYIDRLLEIVGAHNIDLIVPTIDTELLVLAEHAPRFAAVGCTVLVSSTSFITCCRDKWESWLVFSRHGVTMPRSWLPEDIDAGGSELPEALFVKPRDGSASQDTYPVARAGLATLLPRVPNPIIQEWIKAPEITVDALLDFAGRPVHFVPRYRIRTLAGESIQGLTFSDADCSRWILEVLETVASLGGRGPITLQAFLTEGRPTLSEVNPRFGGGFPLTQAAGGEYPEWILRMLEGQNVDARFGAYKNNLYMTRYYEEIFKEAPGTAGPGNSLRP